MYPATFSDRLRVALAADRRLDQEIAKAAGVPAERLSKWKNSHATPELASVESLVRELGVNGHWLLLGEGEMYPSDEDIQAAAFRRMAAIVDEVRLGEDVEGLGDPPPPGGAGGHGDGEGEVA